MPVSQKRRTVTKYSASWDGGNHKGWITVDWVEQGQIGLRSKQIELLDPAEFTAMVDLLRNEKPIYYYLDTSYISTSDEEPGEGET